MLINYLKFIQNSLPITFVAEAILLYVFEMEGTIISNLIGPIVYLIAMSLLRYLIEKDIKWLERYPALFISFVFMMIITEENIYKYRKFQIPQE